MTASSTEAPPAADPTAIRACLSPDGLAAFDAEWESVLDEAKRSRDLAGLRELLAAWRVLAAQEQRAPGTYSRVMAAAATTQRSGRAPAGSVPVDQVRARIAARLAHPG